jgi:hypothetical protein
VLEMGDGLLTLNEASQLGACGAQPSHTGPRALLGRKQEGFSTQAIGYLSPGISHLTHTTYTCRPQTRETQDRPRHYQCDCGFGKVA